MANENDEDTRLELMEQFDEEVEDIIKDVKKMESTVERNGQETFIKTTYNGIEIVIRKSDLYVNASKLVMILKNNNRSYLNTLFKSKNWQEYYEHFVLNHRENQGRKFSPQTFIKSVDTYQIEYRGTWVHPKLVNYIAIWASPKYASTVGEIMDKINETTIVEQEANKANDRMNCVQKVVDDVTDFLSARITKLNEENNELNTDVQHLQTRAVPKGKQRSFCLIVEEVHQYDDQIKIQIRRKMKKTISKGLMDYYKHDTLLFIDNLPIATTINEVIKEQLSHRQGMKIKGTKYTFPYDQLDDIIERIKEIVIEVQDV
ncbi:MAG: hypothetical protein EZS28_037051 [Streblomastix strix]|uniref:KilA-N domain-containing protein n=1 Tax=Streblomastix strix TaxID=222440 RepID=A0A5J4UC23_9EUKA|nr:MAG: hypothetical protein EZS28_037051 [Streblomastix strix]